LTSPTSDEHQPLPPSPCCRRCCLDDRDLCLGCGRSLEEILEWNEADRPRRLAILDEAQRRLQENAARRRF
jgi:hypothetical protein